MKRILSLTILALIIVLVGCSNKKENQVIRQKKAQVSQHKVEKRKAEMTKAQFQQKLKEGKAIILSSNEEKPTFKMEGSKAKAVKMPDGNMWPVKQENGKNIIKLPDGQTVQEKMINGNMILLTDNNKRYEVKIIDGKMVGVLQGENNVAVGNK